MLSKEKVRNQVKSRFYYIFWGTATVAVCAGQIFVGGGFSGVETMGEVGDMIKIAIHNYPLNINNFIDINKQP